jgi:MraZ protein
MFAGEFHFKMDAKGRVSVPAPFRAQGDGKYYVTYGPDGCLFVYDEHGFKAREAELNKLDEYDPKVRSLKRVFFSGPELQECDAVGRIKIPAPFAKYAAIDKDVVMNGMAHYFEIWSSASWEQQRQQDISKYFENYREMTTRHDH